MSITEFSAYLIAQGGPLQHYAFGLTRDRDKARDLVQDSLLKALLNRDKFRPGTDLKAWIRTITKHTFINQYRHQKLGMRLEGDMVQNNRFAARVRSEDDPWAELRLKELRGRIDGLPSAFRDAFILHSEGFKYEEIAQRMAIPMGTVKSRIHQARQQLRSSAGDTRSRT